MNHRFPSAGVLPAFYPSRTSGRRQTGRSRALAFGGFFNQEEQ